jgi:hypothetical protein
MARQHGDVLVDAGAGGTLWAYHRTRRCLARHASP